MWRLRDRLRLAGVVGAALALLATGVVAGAAGGNFILGQANNAGTSSSSLTSNTGGSGNVLLATQNGTGTALRGTAGAGISGFFTSNGGSGVSGVINNGTAGHYGVYAEVSAGVTSPVNAALRVQGNNARGAVITSSGDHGLEVTGINTAVVATATGCTGFICLGETGVSGTGGGFGSGVYGTSDLSGVSGQATIYGVWGSSSATTGTGVYGSSTNYVGVSGSAPNAGTIDVDCSDACDWGPPGVLGTGLNGVIGTTDTAFGVGVVGRTTAIFSYGVYSQGNAYVDGNLSISGTCSGCAIAQSSVNGSNQVLHQGDAVSLLGVRTDPNGSITLVVGPAKAGDAVIGIVDVAMRLEPAKVTAPSSSSTSYRPDGTKDTTKSTGYTFTPATRAWADGGATVAAGAYLRVITSGVFAYKPAAALAVTAGDRLAVGSAGGSLQKAASDTPTGATVGRYLGKLSDGRIVVLVQPS